MILKTEDLTRLYKVGSSTIVGIKDVNLSIEEPTFLAVMGPSGSGKTTLLNLLGLTDRPTGGKILFQDRDVTILDNEKLRKIRLEEIGYIFQSFNLLPTLTALENVELPLALSGASQTKQREEAEKILEAVGLSHRLQHLPQELSLGEMQRVAIARALVNKPSLILADEPTGELDSDTGLEIIRLLEDARRKAGATVVAATHDKRVSNVADKVYTIHNGRVSER